MGYIETGSAAGFFVSAPNSVESTASSTGSLSDYRIIIHIHIQDTNPLGNITFQ